MPTMSSYSFECVVLSLTYIFPSLLCKTLLSNTIKVHCTHCLAGKMHQLSFLVSNKTVTSPFALVHTDLWGPAPVFSYTSLPNLHGYTYLNINQIPSRYSLNFKL